jgi:diketogulonate reductase-like aldo/keto reductase
MHEGYMARVDFLRERNVTLMPHSILSSWPTELAPINDPLVAVLAAARGLSPAAILQRHQLQKGRLVLTRPGTLAHARANLLDTAEFELGTDEMELLDALPWLVQECQPVAAGGLASLRDLVPRCCEPAGR